MGTDRKILSKGIIYLSWALPLLFFGPTLIYNAFINKKNDWHYLVLAIGIFTSIAAVYMLFKGLNTIMKSLFNK